MADRTELLEFRPLIPTIETSLMMSPEEVFQNETLRPILKYQHALLLQIFEHYLQERRMNLTKMAQKQRLDWVKNTIQKDIALSNLLLGSVIGHFTGTELSTYLQHEKSLRKRIKSLIIQRIQSVFKDDH